VHPVATALVLLLGQLWRFAYAMARALLASQQLNTTATWQLRVQPLHFTLFRLLRMLLGLRICLPGCKAAACALILGIGMAWRGASAADVAGCCS
jgi:hypothetical protein